MTITVTRPVHFRARAHGRRVATTKPSPLAAVPDRVPRVARLVALAIKFDGMLRRGEVRTISDLARRCSVTQARMSQILGLCNLAPDLMEQLLFADAGGGRCERDFRPVVAIPDWERQRILASGSMASG